MSDKKTLLLQVADGNQAAYKVLFTQYWDQIYSTAITFTKSRELAQDIAQDTFARIWIKREKLRKVDKFEDFLFIIARNVFIDRLRKKTFTAGNAACLAEYFADASSSPSQQVELKEMEEIIHRGIKILPDRQRTAFSLSRLQGLGHEEIALKMGISKESVKSHIVRAICHLRKYLAGHTEVLPLLLWVLVFG